MTLPGQQSEATNGKAAERLRRRRLRQAALLQQPLESFVFLRWFAACAVLIAPVILRFGLGLEIWVGATSVLAGVLAVINTAFLVLLRRAEREGWPGGLRWMEPAQALVDLVILSILLLITGGIRNPLLMFYVFHVIITGILFDRVLCFSVTGFAILLVIIACVIELTAPGLCPDVFGFGSIAATGHLDYILCMLVAFSVMLLVTAYLTCEIAERVRLEEKRLAAATEHLAKLEDAKSRMLSFVSHELKSPLVAVISCLQAAHTMLVKHEGIPEAAHDMLGRAMRRADQMTVLIRELLDLSRQRSVPETDQREQVDLVRLVRTVADDQRVAAEEKGIDLSLSTPDRAVPIMADIESFEAAIANLVSNAIQYTPDSGSVKVDVRTERDRAMVVVEDSGIGIREEDLEHVFQEFYRSANAKEASRFGTGLGLAIVQTTIENHRGRVTVESEVGRGSTFTVSLPAAQATSE